MAMKRRYNTSHFTPFYQFLMRGFGQSALLFFTCVSLSGFLPAYGHHHARRFPVFDNAHDRDEDMSARTLVNRGFDSDVALMKTRRIAQVLSTSLTIPTFSLDDIPAWLSTLDSDGKWPDNEVDYTTGCLARRSNWPAQKHWQRLLYMAGGYVGVGSHPQLKGDIQLRDAALRAMNYWFGRDLTNYGCLKDGGTDACPCSDTDTTLWNTNWFASIILIPDLVYQVCLLLENVLDQQQLAKCQEIPKRSFDHFYAKPKATFLAGANVLEIAKIGIDLGIRTADERLLQDAYREVHSEMVIRDQIKTDGIRADGAFSQHKGLIYNGNYGKDFLVGILDVELNAVDTAFSADENARKAFETLIDADSWMVIRSTPSKVNHWDLSVLSRFISSPVIEDHATANIHIDLPTVLDLGKKWKSQKLQTFAETLQKDVPSANAGDLQGNRMFYTNDYMVHRGPNYVTTVKMFSTRTDNTECVNTQNPFGFHLSDGAQYTYIRGDEYEDIAASWDWHLIPGITTDHKATNLSCPEVLHEGVEAFVGGVSDGKVGIAAMRYTNPYTKNLSWQKSWFFLDNNVQYVSISALSSKTAAPVISNLDQKRRSGKILIDGVEQTSLDNVQVKSTLWHADVGYVFPSYGSGARVAVESAQKTGSWSALGISTAPPTTVELFTASIQHQDLSLPVSYIAYPGITPERFADVAQASNLQTIQNDNKVSALYDANSGTLYATIWEPSGATASFKRQAQGSNSTVTTTFSASGNLALTYRFGGDMELTVADPSQTLRNVKVTVRTDGQPEKCGSGNMEATLDLPQGGTAGSSVTKYTTKCPRKQGNAGMMAVRLPSLYLVFPILLYMLF